MHATQLNEAAIEFAADYSGTPQPKNPDAVYSNLIDYLLPAEVFYLINSDDEKENLSK